ncbi:hypothetical protein GCM10027440_04460 [Nocardiopsis coralliicola]
MAGHLLALIHSPLVGPMAWESTAECLRRKGRGAVVPSLAGAVHRGPPYYRRLAGAAASALDADKRDGGVVLVGHSGAGALLPAIAEAVGSRVRGMVFVDALLPHPGRSWFATAPPQMREQLAGLARGGRLPRWNEWFPAEVLEALVPDAALRARFAGGLPELPMAYFDEPAPEVQAGGADRCAYVRLSDAYDLAAEDAQRRGWPVYREDADHLAMLTRPEWAAGTIERAAAAAGG